MMLNREFVELIVNKVQELLPETEVTSQEVLKNNDNIYNGILIKKNGESIVPTFYIENYLDYEENDYFTPQNINRIANEIVNAYRDAKPPIDISNIGELINDFSKVKSLLRIRLINKDNNRKLFDTVPYMPFLDMAIIVVIEINNNENGCASIKVTNELLRLWDFTSLSDILPIAKENTFNTPYVLQNMAEIMAKMMGMPIEIFEDSPIKMHVLTNKMKLNGATEICNYSTMKVIADKFESDLIVLPSSINEVIIVPKEEDMDIETLTQMVKNVNGSEVSPEEVLSDHAYVFKRENGWDY